MVEFVYVDETGSTGRGARRQPLLTLAAILVPEDKVQALHIELREVAIAHLGHVPRDFEFHGQELWGGEGPWVGKTPEQLIAVYEACIAILGSLDLSIAYSSINKQGLHDRYNGNADGNAYRLALQFLLEKIDRQGGSYRVVVADESKEQELGAVRMVADLQSMGLGEVPGRQLRTVIDSLHFVSSHASPGVQLADMVAFILQRAARNQEGHPNALEALHRIRSAVELRKLTWREPWPPYKGPFP